MILLQELANLEVRKSSQPWMMKFWHLTSED